MVNFRLLHLEGMMITHLEFQNYLTLNKKNTLSFKVFPY